MRLNDAGYPEDVRMYDNDPRSPFYDSTKADAISDIMYGIEIELELEGIERSAAWVRAEAERRYREND